ncbi:MAG: hypothetical protein KC478_00135 [Bacteriovoracaceae bacterium]|nr:hypothetical protein [Bacteriovoracaceae bacterium]
MKKNALLALAFLSLVGVAWLLESNNTEKSGTGQKVSGVEVASFKLAELLELELPNAKIIKKNNDFVVGELNFPVNEAKLALLVKKLNGLRSVKTLKVANEQFSQFFSHQDHFVRIKTFNQDIKFRIGDVSELTGSFYMQGLDGAQAQLHLIKDTSLFEGFYQNELEADLRKYLDFKDLISSKPFDLIEKQLLSPSFIAGIEKIRIDNSRNRWFELDLVKNTSLPVPPKGVRIRPAGRAIANSLEKVKFDRFIKEDKSSMDEQLSQVEITTKEGVLNLTLFGLRNGNKGLFLKRSDDDKTYIISEGQRFFFENVQSFWDKRIDLSAHDLESLSKIEFELGQDPKELYSFVVDDIKKFSITTNHKNIKINDLSYFNLLFNVIFANNGFEQADMINALTSKESASLIKALKNKIWMKVLGRTLVFAKEHDSIVMLDTKTNLQYVYYDNEEVEQLKSKLFFAFK